MVLLTAAVNFKPICKNQNVQTAKMAKAASRGKIANKINSKKNKGKKDQAVLGRAQKNKIGAKPAQTGKGGNNLLNRGALAKKTKEPWG